MSKRGVNDIAGETIKGISVVIGSDTTGLTAALADVNKASRGIQSELKAVEKLLKMDPGNTELLAQKQKLLTDAVANTSEKLNRLKAAQKEVNAQFAAGAISEGQYRAFQREIAGTEQELSRLEASLSASNKAVDTFGNTMQSNGEKIKGVGEKVKGVGEKMSIGITAPIVAAGAAIVKGVIDAENAQGKLQASLGITADAAADLEAVAQAVWVNGFGENIDGVNEAIVTVRKNIGNLAEDDMQKVTEAAFTIADVFGAEVTDSTKAAGTMMKNFGISGQDALDLITVGFQKGGDYSGELLDTLNEYAPQFASMGLSADQAMGILIAGANAGSFSLDKVGDAMKEFNIRASDGSKTTAEGFSAIGLDAVKMGESMAKGGEGGQKAFMATVAALSAMKDPMAQNMAGTALFGTQWEDVRAKVIVAMADGVKGIGDFKGATDKAAVAMYNNNPGAVLTSAMRELQAAIGPALTPLADIIKNTIVPAVKGLADGFVSLTPAAQKTVLAIVGIAAAVGPLLMILGPIISVVGSIGGAIGAMSLAIAGGATGIGILTTAFPALGAAIAVTTGPIGITIAVIAALAAAAYLIIKNWEPIKEFFGNLWEGIKSVFSGFWDWIKGFLSNWGSEILAVLVPFIGIPLLIVKHWDDIKTGLSAAWKWIQATASDIFTGIADFFVGVWDGIRNTFASAISGIVTFVSEKFAGLGSGVTSIFEGIKSYFAGVWEVIKNIFLGALLLIVDLVTGDFEGLSTDTQAIWSNLQVAFGQIWEAIKQVFQGALDVIKGTLTLAWETITGALKTAWEEVKNYFVTLWGDIQSTASSAWESFKETISSITTNLIAGIKSAWESMITWFTTLPARLKQYATDMFGAMKDGITTTIPQVREVIVNGIQGALDWITDLPGKMLGYGKDIIQGLINGIESMIGRVKDVVSDIAEGIKNKIRSALGINSPSKVMMEIGQYTGLGLAKGMANTVGEVSRQAKALAGAAVPSIESGDGYDVGARGGGGASISNSFAALLHADQIVIANDMDIRDLAYRLEFYRGQVAAARGGV